MPTTANLLKKLHRFHKGKTPVLALADDIGSTLRCLETVTEQYGVGYPSEGLVWALYENAIQTISGLCQHEGLILPSLPTDPANVPPRVHLARLRDWLIRASRFGAGLPDTGAAGEAGVTVGLEPLTDGQREIWVLLKYRILTAKEIAIELFKDLTKEECVRKRISRMKKAGWLIRNKGQRGYYRPDALPPEFQGS